MKVFRLFNFILLTILCGIGVLYSLPSYGDNVPQAFLKEAKTLYKLEEDYYHRRLKSDWNAIYAYQHPKLRENITLDEFKFYDGRIGRNFLLMNPLHVSGAGQQFREYIKKHKHKVDMLGFPIPHKYRLFKNPTTRPKTFQITNIDISKNGKYAKVGFVVTGKGLFPPEIWRGVKEIPVKEEITDFWEKVDGQWKLTLLQKNLNISGSDKKFFMIPENSKHWDHMEFVSIDPKLAKGK